MIDSVSNFTTIFRFSFVSLVPQEYAVSISVTGHDIFASNNSFEADMHTSAVLPLTVQTMVFRNPM